MITTTAAWQTANAKLAKTPIYVFQIGGQSFVYSTHDLVKMGITGSLPTYYPWLLTPTGASQNIDVQGGTSSIGELECEVVDYGGAVRTFIGTHTLEGQSATLLVGYPGTAWPADFATLHTYTLYKIIPSQTYTSYLFRSRDVQIDQKRTIWNHPLNGEAIGASNPWVLQGTPCEIIQAICLLGLGMTTAQIDRATFVQLDSVAESLFSCARPFLFEMGQPFIAKQFLQDQIYKAAGLYPVVTADGRLSVRAFRPSVSGVNPVFAFDQTNVKVLPAYDRLNILNDMLWQVDAVLDSTGSSSTYKTTLLFLNATSISLFQRSNERQVRSDGLRTELGAQWFCQDVASRMFARFADTTGLRGGAPVIDVQAFFLTIPVWVGDYVTVSHPLMPNLFTGALGVSDRVFEVIDREPDYQNGQMKFKLLDTGLTGAAAPNQFTPATPSSQAGVVGTAVIF